MLTRQAIKQLRALQLRKYRRKYGEYLVEGYRLVISAWQAGAPIRQLIIAESRRGEQTLARLLVESPFPVVVIPDHQFEKISSVQHSQGVLAVVRIHLVEAEKLFSLQRVLVLDGVQDPGNVGTLIRSAAWFGMEGVLAGPKTADFFNPKVVRATMGGLWDVRLAVVDNLGFWLHRAGKEGFYRYAADLRGIEVRAWEPAGRGVLVLGSEAHGVNPTVLKKVDERITIPSSASPRGVESLNVAVAGSILMYHWAARER